MPAASAKNRSNPSRYNRLSILLIVVICAAVGYVLLRWLASPAPQFFARAQSIPTSIIHSGAAWYWLEKPGVADSRIVRADSRGVVAVASADQIGAYCVSAHKVAWSEKTSGKSVVVVANEDGSDPRTLWTGPNDVKGLSFAADRLVWIVTEPAQIPGCAPFPPLQATSKILAMALAGREVTVLGTLLEPQGDAVVGEHAGQLYVTAQRPSRIGTTAIYRIPATGGTPHRVAVETGRQRALLTQNGTLYWTAPSPEDMVENGAICVRKLRPDDTVETLTDWLPPEGQLYEVNQKIYYVDGSYEATAWPIDRPKELPKPVALPERYIALAVDRKEMLLQAIGPDPTNIPLYRMPLP